MCVCPEEIDVEISDDCQNAELLLDSLLWWVLMKLWSELVPSTVHCSHQPETVCNVTMLGRQMNRMATFTFYSFKECSFTVVTMLRYTLTWWHLSYRLFVFYLCVWVLLNNIMSGLLIDQANIHTDLDRLIFFAIWNWLRCSTIFKEEKKHSLIWY